MQKNVACWFAHSCHGQPCHIHVRDVEADGCAHRQVCHSTVLRPPCPSCSRFPSARERALGCRALCVLNKLSVCWIQVISFNDGLVFLLYWSFWAVSLLTTAACQCHGRFWFGSVFRTTQMSWRDFQLRQCFRLFNDFVKRCCSFRLLFGRPILLHRTAFGANLVWYVFRNPRTSFGEETNI